jgi:hypothetical protein
VRLCLSVRKEERKAGRHGRSVREGRRQIAYDSAFFIFSFHRVSYCVCVCVFVREREKKRERVVRYLMSLYTYTLCKYTEEYFGRNLFEAFPAEVRPKDACLIIGGRGARSTLHADPFDWMGTNYCLEVLPILVATQLTKVVTDKVLFRGSKLHFNYSSDQLTTGLSTKIQYCLEERIDIYIYISNR